MKRAILVLAVAACSHPAELPAVRFANAPIVQAVNDRRDVPKAPAKRPYYLWNYAYDGVLERRITRALELRRPERAQGVNALDETPDSTWFTNRIGVRDLSAGEVRRGPLTDDSPELHLPWTIKSSKPGGASIGFIIKDARGIKYVLKFDDDGSPEIETGIDAVVNRLLWAAGYNVAQDQVVYFRDEDLVVAKDAVIKDFDGSAKGPLDRAELARLLAQVDHGKDGRLRGLVSRWIEGETLGGWSSEGVRRDDPNDLIPHELRRDLRGAYPIFAWVDHVDIHEGNFVDSWVTDPADAHRHYLRHYLIDFGRSFGAMALFQLDPRRGHQYLIDFREIALSFLSLGIVDREWRHRPTVKGVGLFDATTFDPAGWRPDWPTYRPLAVADKFDKFWGAKIVGRFTRAQIEAAVEAGRFTDPVAAKYIVDTLIARQRMTVAHWFAQVAPLDHFSVTEDRQLCFDDLALGHGVADLDSSRYALTSYDWNGHQIANAIATATERGHTCAPFAPAPDDDDGGYTILRIATTRQGFSGETLVHVGRNPASHALRVIGIWRP